MPLIAIILNPGSDSEILGNQGRIGRLFRLPARGRSMLTNVVEFETTVGVGPQPALGAVESGAVVVAAR